MYSVLQKHEAGHRGWSVKPHETIVLPLPWTGGIRTSQGPGSKHGSWVLSTRFLTAVAKQTPGRNNLRNERLLLAWSLGGVSWQGGMKQIIEAGNTEGGHRKRPGQGHTSRDTLPPEDFFPPLDAS